MTNAYSYIRFSTPEQAQGDSLRRQTAQAEAWATERGLKLDNSLRDLGISAYHGANRTSGALKTFLEMVEDGRIERGSYLIVESLDRISRETVMDAASRLFDLIRAGIIVVTLSDGQEYSEARLRTDWTPLVFSLIVMARAHEESRIKSERVGEAWRQKKAAARSDRKPITPRCPEWLEVRNGAFVERPERVALVRRIFRETIEGFGRREIVRRLNSERIATFRGGEGWHTSSVAKIIESRAVLGEYQPHAGTHRNRNRRPEGEPIGNFYPPIIDEGMFWQAQAAKQGRRQSASGRKGISGAHIFQGLATCAHCGGAMHIINKGKPPKGGIYLACSSSMRRLGCENSRRWRVDKIEAELLFALTFLNFQVLEDVDPIGQQAAAKVDALTTKVGDLERRQHMLVELVELGDAIALARSVELARSIKVLKSELTHAQAEHAQFSARPDLVERAVNAIAISRQMETLDDVAHEKRELRIRLREAIRGIVLKVECHLKYGATATFVARKEKPWTKYIGGRHIKNKFTEVDGGKQAKILLDWRDLDRSLWREWDLQP